MSKTYEQALAEVQADPDKTGSSAKLHQRLSNLEEDLAKAVSAIWDLQRRRAQQPEPVPVTQAPAPAPATPEPAPAP